VRESVCVYVWGREKERDKCGEMRERERERERERDALDGLEDGADALDLLFVVDQRERTVLCQKG
jgi:ribosomal protein S2